MGPSFLLVAVDQFSKLTYIEAVARVTSAVVAKAFRRILERMNYRVRRVIHDDGREWQLHFRCILDQEGIDSVVANPATFENKSFLAESRNAVIRRLLARAKEGGVGLHTTLLSRKIEDWLNRAPNKRTTLSPQETTDETAPFVLNRIRSRRIKETRISPQTTQRFVAGQLVRVRQKRGVFSKSTTPVFSRQLYRVLRALPTAPSPSYRIAIKDGATLPGTYSQFNLKAAASSPPTDRRQQQQQQQWKKN